MFRENSQQITNNGSLGATSGATKCHVPTRAKGKRGAFLEAVRIYGTVAAAAKAAGIWRKTHYRWLKDQSYAEEFQDAQEEFRDRIVLRFDGGQSTAGMSRWCIRVC